MSIAMNPFDVIRMALYIIISIALITHMVHTIKEIRRLKEEGKTPLVAKNIIILIIAYAMEYVFVFFGVSFGEYVAEHIKYEYKVVVVGVIFTLAFLGRSIIAYLSVRAMWGIINAVERVKLKRATLKEIQKSKEEAL